MSAPGKYVEMRAEMDVVVLISNCPQLNNPCNAYNPTPIRLLVWDDPRRVLHGLGSPRGGPRESGRKIPGSNEQIMFEKVLIANRGAIACRIMRTLRRMGVKGVAVYTDADALSRHVMEADEAYCIGSGVAAESYLRTDKILEVARHAGARRFIRVTVS